MTPNERAVLLDALLDGCIDETDLLRIEAELSVDPEVRQEYYRRIQLDLLLQREASSFTPTELRSLRPRSSWAGRGTMLAGVFVGLAASFLLALLAYPWNPGGRSDSQIAPFATSNEPTASGFAILDGQFEAIWSGDSIEQGDLLPEGELHLKSGRIHIELFSGVQMVIEGESLFSIDSPMQVTMHRGRARAHVPEPAQGFRIKTASGDVVDLGTEFTVDVGQDGADVHVVDGEVELRPSRSDAQRMEQGKSLRLAETGLITDATGTEISLISPREFQDLLDNEQSQRLSRWLETSQQMRSDPRLLAHYQCKPDQERSRKLVNLASVSSDIASEGAIVAAAPAVDRWGRSGAALDFSRVGSRVRVTVPGEHRGLTLICWVKINSLDRWYNSLFLTDGHDDREPHWQIMDDGRIFFSVKLPADHNANSASPQQHVYYSPKAWDGSLSGRWIMLCVTYDVDRRRVTHYLNGKPLSSESIPEGALVESMQIGPASICNWSEPMYRTDAEFVLRNLNGNMDEFAMYSGALSTDEIMQFYRVGNPNDL